MLCLEASCTHYCCDFQRVHVLVENSRLIGTVEDRIYLEVAYTGPLPFLEAGILLLEDSYTLSTEEKYNLCLVATYTHSSHGALVYCSCLTSGVEDSSWWGADNFHGFSHSEV